jgi:hypothetical protein
MATGDIYELVYRQQLHGIEVNNVYHFRDEDGQGDAQKLADDFATSPFIQQHKFCATTNLLIISVATRQIYPFVENLGFHLLNTNGVIGPSGIAAVVAMVSTWHTALRGRRYRGRTYWAGVGLTMVAGKWNQSDINALGLAVDALLQRYGPEPNQPTYRMGVWSRKNGVIDPITTSPAGFTPIIGATVRSYVCSMGSRREGHGM